RPWLYRIVSREALRSLERQRHSVPVADLPSRADAGDVEHDLLAWEEKAQIRAAVMSLSEAQRAVVTLRYFLQFKESEVAEMLGLPLSTVKSRLYEARRSLERALRVEAGD